jgi:L-fuculose-phosphate aldolase
MQSSPSFAVYPIVWVYSSLIRRVDAPRQGWEGAPDARLEILTDFAQGLDGIEPGQEIVILTWLHEAQRHVLSGSSLGRCLVRLDGRNDA